MGVKYNWGIEVYLTPTWPAPLFIPPVMVIAPQGQISSDAVESWRSPQWHIVWV